MAPECKFVVREAQPVMSIRTRTPATKIPDALGRCYGEIMEYLGQLGVYPSGPPFTGYFNMDMDDLDLEIGFPVAETSPEKGEIQPSEIPAGRAATATHIGPYDQLNVTYDSLQEFAEEQGVEPVGTVYEFYLNDPQTTAPEELATAIVMPLKG